MTNRYFDLWTEGPRLFFHTPGGRITTSIDEPLVAPFGDHWSQHLRTGGDLALLGQDFGMALRSERVALVVTGGQSGADRAATDVAIELAVPYGGWVPLGGWAEDFPDPPGLLANYPSFREAPTDDAADRTERNVRGSDATLLCSPIGIGSEGSELTWRLAIEIGCTKAAIDPFSAGASAQLRAFAARLPHRCVLNIAGPRASECTGIYVAVRELLHTCSDVLF